MSGRGFLFIAALIIAGPSLLAGLWTLTLWFLAFAIMGAVVQGVIALFHGAIAFVVWCFHDWPHACTFIWLIVSTVFGMLLLANRKAA